MMFKTAEYFTKLKNVLDQLDLDQIDNAVDLITTTAKQGDLIFTCGNGGSAYAASHYITDWNKMYTLETSLPFRGISLCDNIGSITAYGNDISYNQVFSGQLRSLGHPNDLLIVVSGSGNSENILEALRSAHSMSINTLAFVGYDGGKCLDLAQNVVHIPSFDMQFCEDIHLMLGHIIMKKLCNYNLVV